MSGQTIKYLMTVGFRVSFLKYTSPDLASSGFVDGTATVWLEYASPDSRTCTIANVQTDVSRAPAGASATIEANSTAGFKITATRPTNVRYYAYAQWWTCSILQVPS
jgi:hypothetical protein